MIKELKSKKRRNNSELSMKSYTSTEGKGPCVFFFQNEYADSVNIEFYENQEENMQYEDKTYLQLVIEALDEIEKTIPKDKKITLTAFGRSLDIPRDTDRFEIQEHISNFVINNTSFYSERSTEAVERAQDEENNSTEEVKTFAEADFYGPFLDYVRSEYPGAVKIMFDRAYAEDAKYADKTYIQLVVDALGQINNEIEDGKKIYVEISGEGLAPHDIEIPRGSDKYEIQELIINDILKNTTLMEEDQETMSGRIDDRDDWLGYDDEIEL